jgi:endo-alpha-1,4-polygalactosaminidase (GH114 family)
MGELYQFSKIHQYDERKDFKEAWKLWTEENQDIIDDETSRLNNLGYDGDVMDKMFKSARYYFRKKSIEKKQPRQRRQYISVNRELLYAMDNHIEENIFNTDYQPKTGFISFCKENEKILKETIAKFFEQDIKESELIEDKIKKTYKNRYFMLTQIKNK